MIQTVGIDHVALHVRDLVKSRAWYIDVLGFKPYFEIEGHSFLRTGDCQIGLFQARADFSGDGLNHIALQTNASFEEVRKKLDSFGIELTARPEALGWPSTKTAPSDIYFKDPDGNTLQLLPSGTWPQVTLKGTHTVRT